MVSFIILGVGLLGIAALQGNALRYSSEVYLRGQAVIVAYDIFERMRANPAGVSGGYYSDAEAEKLSAAAVDCTAGTCTPRELALFDIAKWSQSISQLLPSGGGTLSATGENEYTVTIHWMDQQNVATTEEETRVESDNSLTISATM